MTHANPDLSLREFIAHATTGAIADFSLREEISFEGVDLEVEARNGKCVAVDFSRCTLHRSTFEDVSFHGCKFRAAELDDCRFEGCSFFDADAELQCDFSFAGLRDAVFERCDLTTANFNRVRAYGLSLIRCQAQGVEFNEADFSLALPRGTDSDVCDATFDGCNLAYADFSGTTLSGCRLVDNRLVHSLWHNANLARADLTGSSLDNIEGHGLVLRGADLRGASFNNLDPREIDLTDIQVDLDQGLLLLRTLGIEVS